MKEYKKPTIETEIIGTTDVILSSIVVDGNHDLSDGSLNETV